MGETRSTADFAAKLAAIFLCVCALVFYVTKFVVFPLNGDFAIMAEVARRLACGAKLYVETCDQKGPVLYLAWAAIWRFVPSYAAFWHTVVVFEAMGTLSCIGLTYKVFSRLARPRAFCVWAFAYALFGGPHVGCADSWALMFSMYAFWVVVEDGDGRDHGIWRYVLIGVLVSAIFWSKWACCVAFLVPLAYGLVNESSRRSVLVGGCVSFLTFFALSLVAVLVSCGFGIFDAMLHEYFGAGSAGYVGYMLAGLWHKGGDSMLVRTIPYVVLCVFLVIWSAKKNHMPAALVGACVLCMLYSCMVVGVIYYRFCGFAAIAACLLSPDSDVLEGVAITNFLAGAISGCVAYSIISVSFAAYDVSVVRDYTAFIGEVSSICGEDVSIACTNSSGIDVLARMGLASPYVYPSPYNVNHTHDGVNIDVSAGRWHYVIGSFADTEVGDVWSCGSRSLRALAKGPAEMVLFGCTEVSDDVILCDAYVVPSGMSS